MKATNSTRIIFLTLLLAMCSLAPSLQESCIAGELSGRVSLANGDAAHANSATIVWIEHEATPELPMADTRIAHSGGNLVPSVSLGFVGSNFLLRSDESKFHNLHLYMHLAYQEESSQRPLHYGATVYNVPLPIEGKEISKPIKPYHRFREETGFIEIICNPHPSEKAYVIVLDHPYATTVDADGRYRIDGIPAGRYPVMAFRGDDVLHVGEIDIPEVGRAELDVRFD